MATFENDTPTSLSWSALRSSKLWPVATIALGLGLWLQLFAMPMLSELQFEQGRLHAILAYMVPLGLLFVGVYFRMAMVLLTFVPVCLLPGLVMLPEPERLMLSEGLSMIRLGASLSLFLAIASAGSDLTRRDEQIELLDADQGQMARMDYHRFILVRIGVLMILFVVPAYAIFQDPTIAQSLSTHYQNKPQLARTFLGLMHFFAWSVATYMMVLMPALNIEYDQRSLNRELKEIGERLTRRHLLKRVVLWFAIAAVVCLFGLLLWS